MTGMINVIHGFSTRGIHQGRNLGFLLKLNHRFDVCASLWLVDYPAL